MSINCSIVELLTGTVGIWYSGNCTYWLPGFTYSTRFMNWWCCIDDKLWVLWCFIHVCFVQVTFLWHSRHADAPYCTHFSTVITPSWITQQILVEKCAHRHVSVPGLPNNVQNCHLDKKHGKNITTPSCAVLITIALLIYLNAWNLRTVLITRS